MLTSSRKIFPFNRRDFFQLNWLGSDQCIWQRCCDANFNSALAGLPCYLSKSLLKRHFLHKYLSTFSESVISEIQNLWRSSFFSKYLKFHLDFKNVGKTCEKTFCFWENCIWIGMIKFSLLRTGYFSLAGNVLTSSPKIFHVNKTELIQLNGLGSGQWIS